MEKKINHRRGRPPKRGRKRKEYHKVRLRHRRRKALKKKYTYAPGVYPKVSIRMPNSLLAKLKETVEYSGIKKSELIRHALDCLFYDNSNVIKCPDCHKIISFRSLLDVGENKVICQKCGFETTITIE